MEPMRSRSPFVPIPQSSHSPCLNLPSSSPQPLIPDDPLCLHQFIPPLFKRTLSGEEARRKSPLPLLNQGQQTEFQAIVEKNGMSHWSEAKKLLDEELHNAGVVLGPDVAIAINGSQGRNEHGLPLQRSFSPFEAIVLLKRRAHLSPSPLSLQAPEKSHCESIAEKICRVIQVSPKLQGIFNPFVEIKDVDSQHKVSTLSLGQKIAVIPTRVFDMKVFTGDIAVLRDVEEQLRVELSYKEVSLGDFNRDFVAHERRVLTKQLTGAPESGVHLAAGILKFNAATRNERGPKLGGLRYLQYSVAFLISQHLSRIPPGTDSAFLQDLPKSIIERVQFLRTRGILAFDEAEFIEFRELYTNLLFWYSVMQVRAIESPDHSSIANVDPIVLRRTLQRALDLGSKIVDQAKKLAHSALNRH